MKYQKLLFACLFATVCTTAIAFPETNPEAAQETTGALLTDNFDSYPSGSFPSGWQLIYNGAGTSQQYVDTERFVSSPKSLRLMGSSCWSANAYRPVTLPPLSSGKKMVLKAKVYVQQTGSGGCSASRGGVYFSNPAVGSWGTTYGYVDFRSDGFIYAARKDGDVQLMAYQIGKWYSVELHVDLSTKTYNVFIDGALKGSKITIYNFDTSFPTGIGLDAGHGSNPIVSFDDVSVSAVSPSVNSTAANWRFDEGSGVGFIDSLSNGARNNGILINGARYTVNVHSSASKYSVLFDGYDDVAAIPDSPTLRPARITVEAWIKPQSGARVVVGKQSGSDCCVNSYQIELNPFRFQLTDTTGQDYYIIGPSNPTANQWHHVAGTWNGDIMKLYLDKKLVASGAFAGAIGYDRNPVLIGGDDDGSGIPGSALFKGLIDQVRISNKALSVGEFMP